MVKTTTLTTLRNGASSDTKALRIVPKGAKVMLLKAEPQNNYYRVKHDGLFGWIFGKHIDIKNAIVEATPDPAAPTNEEVATDNGEGDSSAVTPVPTSTSNQTNPNNPPASDPPVDEPPVDEPPVDEPPVDEPPVDEPPVDEPPVDEPPVSDPPANDPPANDPPAGGVREQAIERAKAAMGFSYWWGHGAWLPEGPSDATAGSCSGSCGSCSHDGDYGADCSGFAAKVWQVPSSNDDITVDSHPYSTGMFLNSPAGWSMISRDALQMADALVYNNGSSGHIVIYESGDAWGSFHAYECKGCSAGCVYNLRTVSDAYEAIQRDGWLTLSTGTTRKAGAGFPPKGHSRSGGKGETAVGRCPGSKPGAGHRRERGDKARGFTPGCMRAAAAEGARARASCA